MGGNPAGIPVVIIGLEKDDFGGRSGGTLGFADRVGLEIVVDDSDHDVLHQFFSPNRGEGTNNSDYVILNGVPNSPSHKLWEIVDTRSFRLSVSAMRDLIDSIEAGVAEVPTPPRVPAEPPVLSAPSWGDGQFSFQVEGTVGHSGVVEYSVDGVNWIVLREVSFSDGPMSIVDESLDAAQSRFYRVISSQ